ncbi:MAG: serine/threonine-protein kinase [Dehalococcoidia bacterium]|nr:serine/threonine-protein kinase [Dehalococcoidia bacterium]
MALTKGDVLDGRYVVEERIGAGGYGTVYRALDRKTKQPVAIKVLRSDLADDPDYQRRFRREADIARMMKSEHVVKVLDTGQAQVRNEDAHFQVMEFVEGETLQERLRRGRLPIRKALLVAAQLAEALEEAEEKGIVHRDIKPKNIFTAKNDFALLGDFGVARATDYPSLRSDDPILGTPRYMSPEQCVGIVDATDVRSDIYSLGIVLYEMIGGKPPFEGDSPNVITYKHVNEKPKPLRGVVKNLPKEADALLQRCLEKRPEDRFQHPGQLRVAIWSVLEANTSSQDTPVTPVRVSQTKKLTILPGSRAFAWVRLTPVVVIALLAFGGTARPIGSEASPSYIFKTSWGQAGSGPAEFNHPLDVAVDFAGYLYVSDSLNGRVQKLDPGGNYIGQLVKQRASVGDWVPNDLAIDTAGNVYVTDEENATIHKFTVNGDVIFEPDQLVTPIAIAVGADDVLYVADAGTHRIQKFASDGTPVAAWGNETIPGLQSPGGIALDRAGNVYVTDWSGNQVVRLTSEGSVLARWGTTGSGNGQFRHPGAVAIDPDGYVYVSDWDNSRIEVFTPDGRFVDQWGERGTGDGQFDGPAGIAFGKDGSAYVVDYQNSRIEVFARQVESTRDVVAGY